MATKNDETGNGCNDIHPIARYASKTGAELVKG
jgi:hypothetical protein